MSNAGKSTKKRTHAEAILEDRNRESPQHDQMQVDIFKHKDELFAFLLRRISKDVGDVEIELEKPLFALTQAGNQTKSIMGFIDVYIDGAYVMGEATRDAAYLIEIKTEMANPMQTLRQLKLYRHLTRNNHGLSEYIRRGVIVLFTKPMDETIAKMICNEGFRVIIYDDTQKDKGFLACLSEIEKNQ